MKHISPFIRVIKSKGISDDLRRTESRYSKFEWNLVWFLVWVFGVLFGILIS